MARKRVRGVEQWCQPLLPGLAEQFAGAPLPVRMAGMAGMAGVAEGDWEAVCYEAACRYACTLAREHLAALEATLHAQRPAG